MKFIISCILLSIINLAFADTSLSLIGRYEYRTDPESMEMLGGFVCFYPNTESIKILPRSENPKQRIWFCFRNKAESKKLLALPTQQFKSNCGFVGTANIRVNSYEAYYGEGDGFDTALLQSVVSHSKPKDISCK